MKKIIAILASLCAVACSGNKTTVYDFEPVVTPEELEAQIESLL